MMYVVSLVSIGMVNVTTITVIHSLVGLVGLVDVVIVVIVVDVVGVVEVVEVVGVVGVVRHTFQHQTRFWQAPGVELVWFDKSHKLARLVVGYQTVKQVGFQKRTVFLLGKLRVCAGREQTHIACLVRMQVHQMAGMAVVDFGVAQRTVPGAEKAMLGASGLVAKLAVDDMLVFQRNVRPVVLKDTVGFVAQPARDAVAQPHAIGRRRHNPVKVGHVRCASCV